PAERLHAIEALGHAYRLVPLGNFEDGVLPWTLVASLDDGDAKVRVAAIKALTVWEQDALGYQADAPADQRQAAVAKWRDWCQQKSGPLP
ncbi:MAG: hypothetical protein AB7K24_15495, partial [Gemmataceae bacterium]